jgi:CheY-like chemotaxis protein
MPRILVIDDNDEIRELIREILEGAGFEVVEASNGDEGIKIFRSDPTDLVITDMIMPEKEGLETMVELRREFPDVKIIAMSGDGFEEPMTYLDGARLIGGALRTFAKPFNVSEFLAAVKELAPGNRTGDGQL